MIVTCKIKINNLITHTDWSCNNLFLKTDVSDGVGWLFGFWRKVLNES